MSALDDMLAEFESNAGTMPQVNPPEAPAVLAAQTAPEVAGQPEPAIVEQALPAPTEKPADVKAAEAAKTRKPRGQGKASATQAAVNAQVPDGWDNTQPTTPKVAAAALDAGGRPDLAALILAVSDALPKGTQITIRSALDL